MWKEKNKDLLDKYTSKVINQEKFTEELFKNQYNEDAPIFFYDKWNEHYNKLNPTNIYNLWKKVMIKKK